MKEEENCSRKGFNESLKRRSILEVTMIRISTKTKIIITRILNLTVSIASIVFFTLSLIFYNISNNLSTDFLALAFALIFIEFFVILPNSVEILLDP